MDRRHFLQSVAAATLAASTPSAFSVGLKQSMIGMDSDGRPFDLANYAGKVSLVSFFTAMLRFRRERWSMNSTPLR